MNKLPKVCIIYTGGTIGMIRDGDELTPPDDPTRFYEIAPELKQIAEIEIVYLLNKDSTNMNPHDWTNMAKAVYDRMGPGYNYQGFVISHGTDTMHFSASALAFAFGANLNMPVVFTGAQTDASVLHGDARINLIRAVKVALQPIAEVVICFGDFVFRGCRTQKNDERRFNAFVSPALYPIADITETFLLHPIVRRVVENPDPIDFRPDFDEHVIPFLLIPGLHPASIMSVLDPATCHGVVLLSFGAGNVPNEGEYSFATFIRTAKERSIPVIIASQFPANSTLDTHYRPGREAIKAGAIPTGNMTNAAAIAKFYWVLEQVHRSVRNGELPADKLLLRINTMMAKPVIGEMDAQERGRFRGE